jgi:type I restriction enzyme S subunit
MIADLKPYREYKESALAWFERVPQHWDIRQARQVGRLLKGGGGTKEDAVDAGVPCVRYGDLYTTHRYFIRASKAFIRVNRAVDYTPIQYGDVLFAASGETIEEIGKSAVNLMHTAAFCGGDVIVLRPSIPVHAPFLGYALDCRPATHQKSTMGRGTTVKHIYPGELRALRFPVPPLEEQAAISRFLDWATRHLDRAIRAKRKAIALLNEQKQTIIHRAVTRGLDPSVPFKPSGIPWLGDIPEHWGVERTKNVFRLRTEKSGLAHGKELLSIYTHIGVRPRKDLEQKGNKASSTDDYWIVRKGDLIVNKLLAWMGAIGASDYEGVTSPAYDILMPVRSLRSDYYHHLFRTKLYLQQFKQRSRGIMDMRLRLYFDQLGQIPVPFPPVDEQAAIVAFYVEATADLTAATTRYVREIDLLREYGTRLVADVVTGKLDVLGAAQCLTVEDVESDGVGGVLGLFEGDEEFDDIEARAEEGEA